MQIADLAIVIALASLVLSVLGPVLTGLINLWRDRIERKEARLVREAERAEAQAMAAIERRETWRRTRKDWLVEKVRDLVEIRATMESHIGWDVDESVDRLSNRELSKAYGEALAVMLSTDIPEIVENAHKIIDYKSMRLERMAVVDHAIQVLAKQIQEVLNEE